jgi:hypothetical protein
MLYITISHLRIYSSRARLTDLNSFRKSLAKKIVSYEEYPQAIY